MDVKPSMAAQPDLHCLRPVASGYDAKLSGLFLGLSTRVKPIGLVEASMLLAARHLEFAFQQGA